MDKCTLNAYRGYTLVEVLVAITVMAIVMSSIILSVQEALNQHHAIKEKQIARWVAHDVVTAFRLGLMEDTSKGGQVSMLGRTYEWHIKTKQTWIPNTKAMAIYVGLENQFAIVSLDAFIEDKDAVLPKKN